MGNLTLDLIILAAVIVTAVVIIVALDRRSKKKGPIAGPGFTPYTWQSNENGNIEQSEKTNGLEGTSYPTKPAVSRLVRFIRLFGLLLVGAILITGASFWAATHKNNPLADIIVIGVIILYFLVPAVIWILRLVNLGKQK